MAPDTTVAKIVLGVYCTFLAAVVLERFQHLGPLAELRSAYDRQRRQVAQAQELHKSWLRMAFQVWEETGERIDRA